MWYGWMSFQSADRRSVAALAVTVLMLALSAVAIDSAKTPTRVIAFVGRYAKGRTFDYKHEHALRRHIRALNERAEGVQFQLDVINIENNGDNAVAAYSEMVDDPNIVLVVDNTAGAQLQKCDGIIRQHDLPVISLNADRNPGDFGTHAVFFGHDDKRPEQIAKFVNLLHEREGVNGFVFVTESDYSLTSRFERAFTAAFPPGSGVSFQTIPVEGESPTPQSEQRCFDQLDAALHDELIGKLVVLNTHYEWGAAIANRVESNYRGRTVLGGPYVVSSENEKLIGNQGTGNRLILITDPSDALSLPVAQGFYELQSEYPQLFQDGEWDNAMYLRRCIDAVALVDTVLQERQRLGGPVTRTDFLSTFELLASGEPLVTDSDVYRFDEQLRRIEEITTFEVREEGRRRSYPEQVADSGLGVPTIQVGMQITSISNVSTHERRFHADFFLWVVGGLPESTPAEGDAVEGLFRFVQFKNAIARPQVEVVKEERRPRSPGTARHRLENQVLTLFRVSGEFSVELELDEFPRDTQRLSIEMQVIPSTDSVRVAWDRMSDDTPSDSQGLPDVPGWRIGRQLATVDTFVTSSLRTRLDQSRGEPSKFQSINVRLWLERRFLGPFVTMLLPLVLIGLVACVVVMKGDSPRKAVSELCGVGLLSIVTYVLGTASIRPVANVLTKVDWLFYSTLGLVAITIVMAVTLGMAHSGANAHDNKAHKSKSRSLGVSMLGAYMVTLWFVCN